MTGASARPWLMLVTDRRLVAAGDLVAAVRAAVAAGVDLVQLREKDLDDGSLERLAQALLAAVGPWARLLINGRSELALQLGEPVGLHLPEHQPLPPRRPGFWGRSVHSPQAAAAAARQGARYLVAGPVYPTSSKPGAT
ncbi:MAG TPA: thiamine phosphate synthase, partial [Limnochordales bacterium]